MEPQDRTQPGVAHARAPRPRLGRPRDRARSPLRGPHASAGAARAVRAARLAVAAVLAGAVLLAPASVASVTPSSGPAPVAGATWPLRPRPEVLAPFAPPATVFGPGHRGVDLAGAVGQPVRAALPGRVRFAGRVGGKGVVVLDHGWARTTYEPVVATVRVGDEVAAGTPIGRLLLLGSHCLPRACLHWGLVVDGGYRDPLGLLGPRPVRLLPLGGPVARSLLTPVPSAPGTGTALRPGGGPAGRPA